MRGWGQLLDIFLGCLQWGTLGLQTLFGVLQPDPPLSPSVFKSPQLLITADPSLEGTIPGTTASIVQGTFLSSGVFVISKRMTSSTPLVVQQKVCDVP